MAGLRLLALTALMCQAYAAIPIWDLPTTGQELIVSYDQGLYDNDTVIFRATAPPTAPSYARLYWSKIASNYEFIILPPYTQYDADPFINIPFYNTSLTYEPISVMVRGYKEPNQAAARITLTYLPIPAVSLGVPTGENLLQPDFGQSYAPYYFDLNEQNLPPNGFPYYMVISNYGEDRTRCEQVAAAIRCAANTVPQDMREAESSDYRGETDTNIEQAHSNGLYIPLAFPDYSYGRWFMSLGFQQALWPRDKFAYTAYYNVKVEIKQPTVAQLGQTYTASLKYKESTVYGITVPQQPAASYPIWIELKLVHRGVQIMTSINMEMPAPENMQATNTQMDPTCQASVRLPTDKDAVDGPQTTYENIVIQNSDDFHGWYILLQSYNFNQTVDTCDSTRSFSLTISQPKSVQTTLTPGSCVTTALAAHSAQYFKLIVPQDGIWSNVKITVTIAGNTDVYVDPAYQVGVAIGDLNKLPLGDLYGQSSIWEADIADIPNTFKGTYYIALLGGIQGYDTPYESRELACQNAVSYLESIPAYNVLMTITADQDGTKQCSGHGICDVGVPGTCNCGKGWEGDVCQTPVCSPACQNGGQCISPGKCQCTTGQGGLACDLCPAGYEGADCKKPICNPPCQNNGVCTAPGKCDCKAASLGGLVCDDKGGGNNESPSTTTATALGVCLGASVLISLGLGIRLARSKRDDDDNRHVLLTDA